MNTFFNPHLFRHREANSVAFNNLCTIIHMLTEEGVYSGEVVQNGRPMGTFLLTCDRKNAAPQVNIDLSKFDAFSLPKARASQEASNFTVGQSGYVVFHVSGHHTGLYVQLTKLQKAQGKPSFDSRRLGKGDLVAFRVWQPGSYIVRNEIGGKKADLTVMGVEDQQHPDLTRTEPVSVTLSGKGFNPSRIKSWPAQAVVITLETPAALTLQNASPEKVIETPHIPGATKAKRPQPARSHRTKR